MNDKIHDTLLFSEHYGLKLFIKYAIVFLTYLVNGGLLLLNYY